MGEARRNCGYRKVGGLYLVADPKQGIPCCQLPIIFTICPACGQGIKQARGWQWIDPSAWLELGHCDEAHGNKVLFNTCPVACDALGKKVGLMWVGEKFYSTPAKFIAEDQALGICKRIKHIPRGFELGKTWVFLAHPKVKSSMEVNEKGELYEKWFGGVFRIFKPDRIEKVVTQADYQFDDVMDALREKGITPVPVDENDPNHQGTVYDDQLGMEV
jgi:hypothetical protein